jgi:CubicO group peptidase (beta-lactamase class C family)
MEKILKENNFTGVALVEQHDQILLHKAYGYADFEHHVQNHIDFAFPIASISKIYAAILTLKLFEQGLFNLEMPLESYFGYPFQQITPHHLLTHTSGLWAYTDFYTVDLLRSMPLDQASLFQKVQIHDLTFKPGTHFEYNNLNYLYLEWFLEKLTQKPYKDLLQELIIDPLNLKKTGFFKDPTSLNAPYGYINDHYEKALPIHPSWLGAGAGLSSTAQDLLIFSKAFIKGHILKQETFLKMLSPNLENYGYGITLKPYENMFSYYHEGGIDGFSTVLLCNPQNNLTLILLSNKTCNIMDLEQSIEELILNKKSSLSR